jgi:protein-disulfide isomerase
MQKLDHRFWVPTFILSVIAVALVAGLISLISFARAGNQLRTEEIAVSNLIAREIADVKTMIPLLRAEIANQAAKNEAPVPPVPALKPGGFKIAGVPQGENPVKGNANAPVLIVEFSDFECPFSKKFYKETLPQLEKDYISTGKVRFAYRDFPLAMHSQAFNAAVAARCAGRQKKFWEMFDKLSSIEKLEPPTLAKTAASLGLKMQDFNACMSDPSITEQVKKDTEEGAKFGVSGTPSFFVNGRFLEGAYPFETLKPLIEEELAEANKK